MDVDDGREIIWHLCDLCADPEADADVRDEGEGSEESRLRWPEPPAASPLAIADRYILELLRALPQRLRGKLIIDAQVFPPLLRIVVRHPHGDHEVERLIALAASGAERAIAREWPEAFVTCAVEPIVPGGAGGEDGG